MEKQKMIFNKEAIPFILEIFGKCVNADGYIVDKETRELVFCPEEVPLTLENFGGVLRGENGEPIFLKSGILTVMKISEGAYK